MKDDSFNEEALTGLLTRLHSGKEEAGNLYKDWHTRLVAHFVWKGVATPEDCADEVLHRVGEKISEGVEIQNLGSYIYGIARNVKREYYKKDIFDPLEKNDGIRPELTLKPADIGEVDERLACLTRCLGGLSARDREMLLAYYADEKNIEPRKQLALSLKISVNTLHLRVHRLRQRLGKCINQCLNQRETN